MKPEKKEVKAYPCSSTEFLKYQRELFGEFNEAHDLWTEHIQSSEQEIVAILKSYEISSIITWREEVAKEVVNHLLKDKE